MNCTVDQVTRPDWNKLTTGGIGGWASANFSSGTLATYGPWKHIVVRGTVNPGGANLKVELFIDGVLEGTDPHTNDADTNAALQFGGNDLYSEDIGGLMSDVAIWNEALDDRRIQELLNGGPVYTPSGTTFSQR